MPLNKTVESGYSSNCGNHGIATVSSGFPRFDLTVETSHFCNKKNSADIYIGDKAGKNCVKTKTVRQCAYY